MNLWIINICSVFILSVFLAGIVIPQILLIAFRRRLFDVPDERKIHQYAIPRLGGIAFKPVIFFSIAILLGINVTLGCKDMLVATITEITELTYGFCAIMLLYLVGIADDLIGVRYRMKFMIQILCASMVIASGLYVADLHGVVGVYAIPIWVAYPLTVLIIVFIINSVNLIDGIDGLASGLCSVALMFYGFAFFILNEFVYAMLSFATLGVLIPFFYFNVFGNPERGRKIFMGDTGSLTIGMVICILSIKLAHCTPTTGMFAPNPMVLAFSPLLIPCLDVVRVYFHRVRNGMNPFMPDKNHIHHKLLAIGMRQRTAMITIVFTSIFFSLSNILLSQYINITLLLILDFIVWIASNMWLSNKIKFRVIRINVDK